MKFYMSYILPVIVAVILILGLYTFFAPAK